MSFPHLRPNAPEHTQYERSELPIEWQTEIAESEWETVTYIDSDDETGNEKILQFVYLDDGYIFPQEHRYELNDHRVARSENYRLTNAKQTGISLDDFVEVRKIQAVLEVGVLAYKAPKKHMD